MSASRKTSSEPENYSWSDLKCLQISAKDFFPSHVTDTDTQKEIVTNFLNFYLSGKVKRGVTTCDVIFAAISLMPQPGSKEQFIWPSVEYKDDGTLFFISAEDKLRAEIRHLQLKRSTQKDEDAADLEKEEANKDHKEHASVANGDGENSFNRQHKVEKSETAKEPLPSGASMNPTEQINAQEESDIDVNVKTQSTKEGNDGKTDKEETGENKKPTTNKLFLPDKWTNFRGSNRETKSLNYGPLENSAFNAHCNKLLDAWQKCPEDRIQLKLLFGYVALTLLRSTAKSPKHLYNTFSSERFITSLRQLIAWDGPFSVPHKKCVIKSHRVLTKKDAKTPTMFAKIVYYSLYRRKVEEMTEAGFRNCILTTTVLSHTFDYGLGIFNLLRTLQTLNFSGKMMEIIYDVTICDETKESWENLNNFVNEYLSEPKHLTYHWARIMDNNAFKKLSCQHNYGLSVILGVFIEKELSKANVWEADWVKKNGEHLEYYKVRGAEMHEIFSKRKIETERRFLEEIFNPLNQEGIDRYLNLMRFCDLDNSTLQNS